MSDPCPVEDHHYEIVGACDECGELCPGEPDPCPTCDGNGCEEGCGAGGGCEHVYAGPDSHKVCPACEGSGQAVAGQALRAETGDTGRNHWRREILR